MLFRLEIKAQKRTAIRTSCPMQIRDFICFIAFLNWTRWQYWIPKRENRTAEAGGSQLSHNIFFTLPAEFGLCHFIPYFYLIFLCFEQDNFAGCSRRAKSARDASTQLSTPLIQGFYLTDIPEPEWHTFYIFPLAGATKESGRETWPGLLNSDLGCDVIWSIWGIPSQKHTQMHQKYRNMKWIRLHHGSAGTLAQDLRSQLQTHL